jgi:hypothetical protein
MNRLQVGRWTYHFDAPDGLVVDVACFDDTSPKSAEVVHWPALRCRVEGGHQVGKCGLYECITMPVHIQRADEAA